jgi:hypothetical protein
VKSLVEVTKMKALLAVLLFAAPAFAQNVPATDSSAPDCSRGVVSFAVKQDSGQHPVPNAQDGKAMVVFLQDDAKFASYPRPTTRFAVDGNWVGATHANSYFYISIDPGEHHLCADWQSLAILAPTRPTAALHFTAEAGKVYYFRASDIYFRERGFAEVAFNDVDSDEALILLRQFSHDTSKPKK